MRIGVNCRPSATFTASPEKRPAPDQCAPLLDKPIPADEIDGFGQP
jgi:hypothetical protein